MCLAAHLLGDSFYHQVCKVLDPLTAITDYLTSTCLGKIAPEFQDYATGSETSSLLLRFPVPDLARAEQSQEQDEEDQTDADYTPDTDRPSKIRRVKQNTLFPFIILVPEANGEESFKAFSELPATVQDELKKRFEDTRLSCSTRERIFKRVCNNPDRFPAKELCVRYLLVSNGGNSYIKAAYRDGGAYEKGADDMCIGHNNPCACLKHHHGDFAFCFVPLPAKLRTGKTWQELRFWVLSGQHRV